MEPGTYFAIFVLMVGALHLIWGAAAHISSWMGKSPRYSDNKSRKKTKRDDWYVFFNVSDLTGKKPQKSGKSKEVATASTKRKKSSARRSGRATM